MLTFFVEPERSDAEQEIYETMLSSDDKVFHYALYEWLVESGYRDRIVLVFNFDSISYFLDQDTIHRRVSGTRSTQSCHCRYTMVILRVKQLV
jgi:hypothetical protein